MFLTAITTTTVDKQQSVGLSAPNNSIRARSVIDVEWPVV
jgi:hypothetical protein